MLHTVVIDAHALRALDQLFARTGEALPRSAVVDRRHGLDWHAVPIDAGTITAIQHLRHDAGDSFNDCLRRMLDLPAVRRRDERLRPLIAARPDVPRSQSMPGQPQR